MAEIRLHIAYFDHKVVVSSPPEGQDARRATIGSPGHAHAFSTASYGSPPTTSEGWVDVTTTSASDGFSWGANLRTKTILGVNSSNSPFACSTASFIWDVEVVGQQEFVTVDAPIRTGYVGQGSVSFGTLTNLVTGQIISNGWGQANGNYGFALTPGRYRFQIDLTLLVPSIQPQDFTFGYANAVHFTNLIVVPGASQNNPILGAPTVPPVAPGRSFTAVPRGRFYDPPLAQGYTFTATGTALFKEIMAFPSGIPAEYYVTTEGSTYGPFEAQQSMSFVTLHGHAVGNFVVKGIKPFVDATSPVAFPIMLDFTEELADFTMIPIAAPDVQLVTLPNGDLQFTFVGVLQSSSDLNAWTDVTPEPVSPYVLPKAQIGGSKVFRATKP